MKKGNNSSGQALRNHPGLTEAVGLLSLLVSTPSFSREEEGAADIWESWLKGHCGDDVRRFHNNVWIVAPGFDPGRQTLMLNSHMDTVRPASSYSRDPFSPSIEEGRIYGLGSNDAGASGVSLACTFLCLKDEPLPFNLIFAITAAEEVMGEYGMRAFLPHLEESGMKPDMVIVGEPTGMQPAIAERGLVVIDAVAGGKAGHAARDEGINAIYRAIADIERLKAFTTPDVSPTLGPIRVNVTMIEAGTQHNAVPDKCKYVVDVRTTDAYTNEETVELLQKCVTFSTLTPRSTRIHASVIDDVHPLVKAAKSVGREPFVSPTTSDMAVMHGIPSLKIGPGQSSRSHSADEYVLVSEIEEALELYPKIIKAIKP